MIPALVAAWLLLGAVTAVAVGRLIARAELIAHEREGRVPANQ